MLILDIDNLIAMSDIILALLALFFMFMIIAIPVALLIFLIKKIKATNVRNECDNCTYKIIYESQQRKDGN